MFDGSRKIRTVIQEKKGGYSPSKGETSGILQWYFVGSDCHGGDEVDIQVSELRLCKP